MLLELAFCSMNRTMPRQGIPGCNTAKKAGAFNLDARPAQH